MDEATANSGGKPPAQQRAAAADDWRDAAQELDARGLLCPLPVLKARKRLQAMAPGETLRLLADDPAAVVDVPHFCAEAGHALVAQRQGGYLIRKGG